MKNLRFIFMICLVLVTCNTLVQAQDFDYRFSFTEEATKNYINENTPLNWNNSIVPQTSCEHIGSANLSSSYGVLSGSFGFTAKGSDLAKTEYDFAIHELTADVNLTEQIDFQIGKKILKWGTGYAFNPTGVVEPGRLPSDPSDRLKLNDGRNLASLTMFIDKNSFSIVYLNDYQIKNSKLYWSENEIAARANTYLGGFDLSLVGHYKSGNRLELGFNSSCVIGDNLEIHGEVLGKKGSSQEYHEILNSNNGVQKFFTTYPYSGIYDSSEKLFWKILVGSQYTFDNGLNVVLEYYHNDDGLSPSQWKTWLDFVKFHNNIQNGTIEVASELVDASKHNLLWALKTLSTTRGVMKDYFFTRIYYSENDWISELLCMINANDGSSVLIPTFTYKFSKYLSAYLRYSCYAGSSDSEYRNLFMKAAITFGCGFQI